MVQENSEVRADFQEAAAFRDHLVQHLQNAEVVGQLDVLFVEILLELLALGLLVVLVEGVAIDQFGRDRFIPTGAPSMSGEDFAYYLEQVPGCFVFLGLRPESVQECPGLHHPLFNFNDDALPTAIQLLAALAIGRGSAA